MIVHPFKIVSGLGLALLAYGVGTDSLDSFQRVLCTLVLAITALGAFAETFEL